MISIVIPLILGGFTVAAVAATRRSTTGSITRPGPTETVPILTPAQLPNVPAGGAPSSVSAGNAPPRIRSVGKRPLPVRPLSTVLQDAGAILNRTEASLSPNNYDQTIVDEIPNLVAIAQELDRAGQSTEAERVWRRASDLDHKYATNVRSRVNELQYLKRSAEANRLLSAVSAIYTKYPVVLPTLPVGLPGLPRSV